MRALSAAVGLVVLVLARGPAAQDAGSPSPSLLGTTFSELPIYFIENRGVYPDEVTYYVQGAEKTLFFTKQGITFRLEGKERAWVVKLEFVGANPDVVPRGKQRQPAVFSYFRGPVTDWKTELRTFTRIVYEELWPGIDLVYKGTGHRLKYEFVVKPGVDPGQISLMYRGATNARVTESGGLSVETPVKSISDEAPVAWQGVDGERVKVAVVFVETDTSADEPRRFAFRTGEYDTAKPLIIDPAMLVYCGYLGGAGDEGGSAIAVDAIGNLYLGGTTTSSETTFPVKVGPSLKLSPPGFYNWDVFVAKVSADGRSLIYCGYIGGKDMDNLQGIAVDAGGNAIAVGDTASDEKSFPVTVGPFLKHKGGSGISRADAFVAKVSADGSRLLYCGYIGGVRNDFIGDVAVDVAGNAYVVGSTESNEKSFPVKTGPFLKNAGSVDAFVAKVSPDGRKLDYCGYIGGTNPDYGSRLAVNRAGEVHVAGRTNSSAPGFPVKVGPDLKLRGYYDAFVAKVSRTGADLIYCGYIGGNQSDEANDIGIDAAGAAYVVGRTASSEATFPVKVGPLLTRPRVQWDYDAFVAKVQPSGQALEYCGYIDGVLAYWNTPLVAVDGAGHAHLTGAANVRLKTKVGPDVTWNGGQNDAFVAKLDPSGKGFVYAGFIGGTADDYGRGVALDAAGNVYVTGNTRSDEKTFPVRGAWDLTYNGGSDVFFAKVPATSLGGTGSRRPGATLTLDLVAPANEGLRYQVGSSLSPGPIWIDNRRLDLSLDALFTVTVGGFWPMVFSGYRGVIDSNGMAKAAIHIPNIPALIGVRLHSAFVTLSPSAPSGIKSISNTFSFSIAK